jgi:hypothetical protein
LGTAGIERSIEEPGRPDLAVATLDEGGVTTVAGNE